MLTTHDLTEFEYCLGKINEYRASILGRSYGTAPMFQTQMQAIWIENLRRALISCFDIPNLTERISMLTFQVPGSEVLQEIALMYAQIIEFHIEVQKHTKKDESTCPCSIS